MVTNQKHSQTNSNLRKVLTVWWEHQEGTYFMVDDSRHALIQTQLIEFIESAGQHFAWLGQQKSPITATLNCNYNQGLGNIHLQKKKEKKILQM